MPETVQYTYNDQTFQTVSFTEPELQQLAQGQMPKALLLQDMDGVHNINFQVVDRYQGKPEWMQALAVMRNLYSNGNLVEAGENPSEDPSEDPTIDFTIINKPVLNHLAPVYKALALLPLLATQRLVLDPKHPLYTSAITSAAALEKIPAFEYFAKAHSDEMNKLIKEKVHALFSEHFAFDKIAALSERLMKEQDSLGYISAYFDLLTSIEANSLANHRVKSRLRGWAQMLKEMGNQTVVKGEDEAAFDNMDVLLGQFQSLLDTISSDYTTKSQPIPESKLASLQAIMDTFLSAKPKPDDPDDSEKVIRVTTLLEDIRKFTKTINEYSQDSIASYTYLNGFFKGLLKDAYFEALNTLSTADEKAFFKALWQLHYDAALSHFLKDEATFQSVVTQLTQDINDCASRFSSLDDAKKMDIQNLLDINTFIKAFHAAFDDFKGHYTSGNKQIILDAWRNYLKEQGVDLSETEASLVDDNAAYKPSLDGQFVLKDVGSCFDQLPGESLLELLDERMLDHHLIQLCLFRPPLMAIALLVVTRNNPIDTGAENPLVQAYSQAMPLSLLNHPVLDAALFAVVKNAFQGDCKHKILDPLVTAALTVEDHPVFINRFVAQAFNWICEHLDYLPKELAELIRQAKTLNEAVSHQFLLGRIFKAVFKNITDCYDNLNGDEAVIGKLKAIGETFGFIGLPTAMVSLEHAPVTPELCHHLNGMILADDKRLAGYVNGDVPLGDNAAAYQTFSFQSSKEVYAVEAGFIHKEVYCQLFLVEGGKVIPLQGDSVFVEEVKDINGAVQNGKVFGLIKEGQFYCRSGAKGSSDPAQGISPQGVLTYQYSEDGLPPQKFLTIECSLPIARYPAALYTFNVGNVLSFGGEPNQYNPMDEALTEASEAEIQAGVAKAIDRLKLPKAIQDYLFVLVNIWRSYQADPVALEQQDALDVLRLILCLKAAADERPEADFSKTDEAIAGAMKHLSSSSGFFNNETNRLVVSVYGFLWLSGIIVASLVSPAMTVESFNLNYGDDVTQFFLDYVLPALRSNVAWGYGGLGLILIIAVLSGTDLFRSEFFRYNESSELTGIIDRVGAHRPFPIVTSVLETLIGDYRGAAYFKKIFDNASTGDKNWSEHKKDALRAILQSGNTAAISAPLTSFEKRVISWTTRLKRGALPVLGGISVYPVFKAVYASNSSVIQDFSGEMLQDIMRLSAVMGGRQGVAFFVAIGLLLTLLPDAFLVQTLRAFKFVFNALFCGSNKNTAALQGVVSDGNSAVAVSSVGMHAAGSGSAMDALREPLLSQTEDPAQVSGALRFE